MDDDTPEKVAVFEELPFSIALMLLIPINGGAVNSATRSPCNVNTPTAARALVTTPFLPAGTVVELYPMPLLDLLDELLSTKDTDWINRD